MTEEYKGFTLTTSSDQLLVNPMQRRIIDDLTDQLTARAAWQSFTPVWSSSGTTQPSLNNGTLAARYTVAGKRVTYMGSLTMGSSTNGGAGSWRMTLPVAANATYRLLPAGSGLGYIPGAAVFAATAFLPTATTLAFHVPMSSSTAWLAEARNADNAGAGSTGYPATGAPYPWVPASELRWTITYEAA